MRRASTALVSCGILFLLLTAGCGKEDGVNAVGIPAGDDSYVVFAWNDLGMHCLNPTYDTAVLLPPYNTVWAQVVRRGNPPQVVTEGLSVQYRVVNNTHSYDKTDANGGDFGQFWDYCQAVFGVDLPHDRGLNLEDPAIHNGLSGTMVTKQDHFQVNGIPVTPVDDSGIWNPYQVLEVTVYQGSNVVATTRTTIPTSDEINCARCHTESGQTVFENVLVRHDALHGTSLMDERPVLCANGSCHGSPALGQTAAGDNGYLSKAIHAAHADRGAACYDCHPGTNTKCNRSLAHTNPEGNCTACHGTLAAMAQGMESGRVPWAEEPKCGQAGCHTGVQGVDTGQVLYRNAAGHGNLACPACHSSPHAIVSSRETSDNYQAVQYQTASVTIGSCGACHENSHGEGAGEFGEEHGGSKGRVSACRVCHTSVSSGTSNWPHAFTWKAR